MIANGLDPDAPLIWERRHVAVFEQVHPPRWCADREVNGRGRLVPRKAAVGGDTGQGSRIRDLPATTLPDEAGARLCEVSP